MSKISVTVSQVAATNKISKDAASALIQYLRAADLIENVGSKPKEAGQRGRGEAIYEGDGDKIQKHLGALKLS